MAQCPNCGFNNPDQMRFCGMCGTALVKVCARCQFANPTSFRFCGMCGAPLEETERGTPSTLASAFAPQTPSPMPAPVVLEGERRIATVLVADVQGSTQLLEKLGSEAWVETMNHILNLLENEVQRFGGEVEQFRGDGLVALFGATRAREDDPERAVLAALLMQKAVNTFAAQIVQTHNLDLKLRIGISTGEVIVPAARLRRPYGETAMGAAVTMAARMETAAEPGTVLVSESTYRLVESQFKWLPLGEVRVRGLNQPMQAYRPLAPAENTSFQEEILGEPAAMIGRKEIFIQLKQCVNDMLRGRSRIVMLTGDRGMGKSLLVNRLRDYFAHRSALLAGVNQASAPTPSLLWLRGRCRSYHQPWPYSMWIDLLNNWLTLHSTGELQSKEAQRALLQQQCAAIWTAEAFQEHYPYLAALLDLPPEDAFADRTRHLDAEGLRHRYFLAVRSWLEALSQTQPLVLHFADMQWAGESSLELLKYCLPLCETHRILMLLVFRMERDTPTHRFAQYLQDEYPHRLTHINLPPLDAAQSETLIAEWIGADTLPTEARQLIIQKASGNPYYIREMLRALISNGTLAREEGRWRLTRPVTTLDLPDNLQQLLIARIDQLHSDERFVLQVASVIGSTFWHTLLQAIIGDSVADLNRCLFVLQREQLIQETEIVPELGMQYIFKLPLVRDAAYESLLRAQRIAFHARIAEYLSTQVEPGALVGYYAIIASHYRGAEDLPRELRYTLLAAQEARQIHANTEALHHYARALELLDRLELRAEDASQQRALRVQRFEVLQQRIKVWLVSSNFPAALQDARHLLQLADQLSEEPTWRLDALLSYINAVDRGDREQVTHAVSLADEALQRAQALGDRPRELHALIGAATLRLFLNDHAGKHLAEQALALARDLGDLKSEVKMLITFTKLYGADDLLRSEEYLQAALARSEALQDKATKADLLGALSARFERQGDYYRQLVECEQRRLHICREIGDSLREGHALTGCGQIQGIYLGDFENGLALLEEALRIWEPVSGRLFPLLRIAQIYILQSRLRKAEETLALAEPLSRDILTELGRAGFGLVEAMLHLAYDDETRLYRVLDSTRIVHQQVAYNLVSRQYHMAALCLEAQAHLELALKLTDPHRQAHHRYWALESSQAALRLYREFGFTQIVECTAEAILHTHSRVLALHGRMEESRDFLQQAYNEMMRKHALIPSHTPFARSYLDLPLHREIASAHEQAAVAQPSA